MSLKTHRKYLTVFLFFILFTGNYFSQNENYILKRDSLIHQFRSDSTYIYRFKKFRTHIKYSERNSLGNPHPVNFYGPQLGILYNEKHVFALGFYLSSPKTRAGYHYNHNGIDTKEYINIKYGTFYYQYVLFNRRFIEFQVPFELGIGNYHARYIDQKLEEIHQVDQEIVIGSAGFSFLLKPFKWLGVVSSIGIRKSNIPIVDGAYYLIGIRFSISNLKNDIDYHLIIKKKFRKEMVQLSYSLQ